MPTSATPRPLTIPPRSRLLYIGPPKTGTTTVQEAARVCRRELYEHGVYYPGNGRNHRRQFFALLGRPDPLTNAAGDRTASVTETRSQSSRVPPTSEWDALMKDINAEQDRRVLLSHESAAGASDDIAERFVAELGEGRTHVAVTLRPLLSLLPSRWVEEVKVGESATLDDWLLRVFGETEPPISPELQRYLDHGGIVERWASAAGRDNVTVIIVDKANRSLLTDTFEDLLGIPRNMLSAHAANGLQTNRSLTVAEVEIFRQLNASVFRPDSLAWPVYLDVVSRGAIERVLSARTPTPDEPRLHMPPWAAQLAVRRGRSHADRIRAAGVRVVGDLGQLYADHPSPAAGEPVPHDYREEIAVQSLVGAVNGAAKAAAKAGERAATVPTARPIKRPAARPARPAPPHSDLRPGPTLRTYVKELPESARIRALAETFTTRELLRACKSRVVHKVRTRRSM